MSAKPKHIPNGRMIGGKKSPVGNAIDKTHPEVQAENEERDLANLVGLEPIETTEDEEEIFLELEELVDLPEDEARQDVTTDYSASQVEYDMDTPQSEENAINGFDNGDYEEEPDRYDEKTPTGRIVERGEYIDPENHYSKIRPDEATEYDNATSRTQTDHYKYDNRQYLNESRRVKRTEFRDDGQIKDQTDYHNEAWENGRTGPETGEYEEDLKEYFNEFPAGGNEPENADYQENPRQYRVDPRERQSPRTEVGRFEEDHGERYQETPETRRTRPAANRYQDEQSEYYQEIPERRRTGPRVGRPEMDQRERYQETPETRRIRPAANRYEDEQNDYYEEIPEGKRTRPRSGRPEEDQRERYQETPETRRTRPAANRYEDEQNDYYEEIPEGKRTRPRGGRPEEDQRDQYRETPETIRTRPAVNGYEEEQGEYYQEIPEVKRTRPRVGRAETGRGDHYPKTPETRRTRPVANNGYEEEQSEYYEEIPEVKRARPAVEGFEEEPRDYYRGKPVTRKKGARREPYPNGYPDHPDYVPQRRSSSESRPIQDRDYRQEIRQTGPVRPDRDSANEKYGRDFPDNRYVKRKSRPGSAPYRENRPLDQDNGPRQRSLSREDDRQPEFTRGIDHKAIDEHLEEFDSFEEELGRKKERKRKASVFNGKAPSKKSKDQVEDDAAGKPDLAATEIDVVDVTSGLWMDNPDRFIGVMENLRLVKNKIAAPGHNNSGKDVQLRTFMFTGAGRRVGTSTLLANLGVVFARDLIDRRMLLVDANVASPSVHQFFNIPQQPGIMDYLLKNYPLNHTLKHSHYKNLDLIPIGEVVPEVSSPFELKRFTEFLEEVSHSYDFVLVDASPTLQSSHSRILSSKLDGVIVVAESNVTRWEVLLELKNQLEKDGANLVGGILNKRRFVIPKWVYRFF